MPVFPGGHSRFTAENPAEIIDVLKSQCQCNRGFILNGNVLALHGVSRHQDRKDIGWAQGPKEMEEDMALILEMGANSIRLAHYQHNRYFYDLCDRAGIVTWAEIPYISMHSSEDLSGSNALSQMEELVKQNMNHPSIAIWGVQNEITIGGTDETILNTVTKLHELTKHLDPSRPTAQAQVGQHPDDDPLNGVTDMVGYNKYYGWYYDTTAAMGEWLDRFHREQPHIPLGITEYGCEAVLKYHSDKPERAIIPRNIRPTITMRFSRLSTPAPGSGGHTSGTCSISHRICAMKAAFRE